MEISKRKVIPMMREFNTEQEYHSFIWSQLSYAHDLCEVQSRWVKERGSVPFSSYVPVVEYFLRPKNIPVDKLAVKSRGNSIRISFRYKDFSEYVFEVSSEKLKGYSISRRILTAEELDKRCEEDFPKNCKKYGLAPEDLGKTVELPSGRRCMIIGCEKRKQKFGIRCRYLETGTSSFVNAELVLAGLKKGDLDNA